MSEASTTNAPESPAQGARRVASRRVASGAIAVVLLAAVAIGGWRLIAGPDYSAAAIECETTVVTVVVAAALVDPMEEAAASLKGNGQCIELDVNTATVAEVAAAQDELGTGKVDALPDLWVPDSPAWPGVLKKAGLIGKTLEPALAMSPVGLASGSKIKAPANWLDTLESRRLVMADPRDSGAFAVGMVAPFSETALGGVKTSEVEVILLSRAQRYGGKAAAGRLNPVTLDSIPAGSRRMLPVTEHDFMLARESNEALTWTKPATGAGALNFPLLQPHAVTGGGEALDVAGRTGEKIAAWFASKAGAKALAGEMLRGPDGAPLPGGADLETGRLVQGAQKAQVDGALDRWRVLAIPSSMLAVIDASASMDFSAGGGLTRASFAVDGTKTALASTPEHTRVGLWVFSTNRGPEGRDWQELAPLRRLDALTGDGRTQYDKIQEQVDTVPALTRGGSGLYDTVLAAYVEAQREYDPAYDNSVVVLTDGGNDDPSSISLQQLLKKLTELKDSQRPVSVHTVGLSSDADLETIRAISSITGGESAEAEQPADVLTAMAQTLLAR